MRATIETDWLRQNVHRWRGAITITHQTVFEHWWGEPYKGPVGLAGRPEDVGSFVACQGDGVDIYVANDVWACHVGTVCPADGGDRLCALLPGYGMAWFRFEPWDEEQTLWTYVGVRSFM